MLRSHERWLSHITRCLTVYCCCQRLQGGFHSMNGGDISNSTLTHQMEALGIMLP